MQSNKQLLEQLRIDLALRGFFQNTQGCYLLYVRKFLEYANLPIGEISEAHVRFFS